MVPSTTRNKVSLSYPHSDNVVWHGWWACGASVEVRIWALFFQSSFLSRWSQTTLFSGADDGGLCFDLLASSLFNDAQQVWLRREASEVMHSRFCLVGSRMIFQPPHLLLRDGDLILRSLSSVSSSPDRWLIGRYVNVTLSPRVFQQCRGNIAFCSRCAANECKKKTTLIYLRT